MDDLKEMVTRFKALIKERTGKEFPQDPWKQLWGAVGAVFGSWMNDRAIVYRRKYNIPSEWGTAVNVQAMVYGNTGDNSGSGVAFTRDPATGEKVFYGEFLINAQGEDVVAGVRTPEPVAQLEERICPTAFAELENIRKTLETHFKDVQDFEFTIQEGKVFMLQTRNGKRTGLAAVRFAIEMEKEKLIDWKTAIRRVPADQLDQVLAPVFDRKAVKDAKCIAKGLPAGPGRGLRQDVFECRSRGEAAEKGEKVLLVRNETSPEDLRGMIAAEGILTAKGGVSSHAALVARQMGKVCVCGASALQIDYAAKTMTVDGADLQGRRFHFHQRHRRRSVSGRNCHGRLGNRPGARRKIARCQGQPDLPDVRETDGLVRESHAPAGAHQRGQSRADRQRRRVRRHAASACAARNTCSSKAIASTPCAK